MNEFVTKLSSYNLLNYLLTGVVFVVAAENLIGWHVPTANAFVAAFLFYFMGMVVSRFGSIVLEPLLESVGFIDRCDYEEFVEASACDPKVEILSEQNNVYRTVFAGLVLLGVVWGFMAAFQRLNLPPAWVDAAVIVGLALLFGFSYRKQCGYVSRRVRATNRSTRDS